MATPKRSTGKLTPHQLARRLEVGEAKRAQTRRRIMQAAYDLFARHGDEAPTVDIVVECAGVARGSFYNHFASRDALFRAVAEEIATSINAMITPRLAGEDDPAVRVAIAFRLFVHFALAEEARGWILLRTLPLVGFLNDFMRSFTTGEFQAGRDSGRFSRRPTDLLVSLGLGLLIMTINRGLRETWDDGMISEAGELLLLGLGVGPADAQRISGLPLDYPALLPPPDPCSG